MANNIDIFSGYALTNAVNKLKPARTFLLQSTFRMKENHAARTVLYGKTSATDKLALFVNPEEEPLLVGQSGKEAKQFKLPITREKNGFAAEVLAQENSVNGKYLTTGSDISQNSNEKILRELDNLKSRSIRLWEWMAAQAVSEGSITVAQDNIAFHIDFGFVAGTHLITRAGTDLWTNAASDPLLELRTQKRAMAKRGYVAKRAILGAAVADAFIGNAQVVHDSKRPGFIVDKQVNATNDFTDFGNFLGNYAGLDIYEYSYQYTSAANVVTNMMNTNKCVILGEPSDMTPGSQAFRLHNGPKYRFNSNKSVSTIMDRYFMESFPNEGKTWLEWRLETCGLPAIHDPDAVVSLIVTA